MKEVLILLLGLNFCLQSSVTFARESFYGDDLVPEIKSKGKLYLSKLSLHHHCINMLDEVLEPLSFLVQITPLLTISRNIRCRKSIDNLYEILNCRKSKGTLVCFVKEFEELVHSEEFRALLDKLTLDLAEALNQKEIFYLWNWMKDYFYGDEVKATKVLGVIFQDVNVSLVNRVNIRDKSIKSKLDLIYKIFSEEKYFKYFSFLPYHLNLDSFSYYHYYVMRHASYKMRELKSKDYLMLLVPAIFNSAYEFYKAQGVYYSIVPELLNSKVGDLHDIYMGFSAIYDVNIPEDFISFDDFNEKTETQYHDFLLETRLLLKESLK